MKKTWKRLCTGFLALVTVVTALPTTPVHAESKQYWTESKERVGIVEKVMNNGSIGSTFNEGHLTVEGEDAYCIDINTDFKNGYKTQTLGLETMEVRFARQAETCLKLAQCLQELPEIESVNYTGLESNPFYELSTRQFGSLPGAMLTFDLPSREICFRFINQIGRAHV